MEVGLELDELEVAGAVGTWLAGAELPEDWLELELEEELEEAAEFEVAEFEGS